MDTFTDEECENLINLVSQHPALFDLKDENYKNPSAKDTIWWNIAQELNTTSDKCKRHWKTIRDGYKRFKRRSKLSTGLVAPKNRRTKWKIYRLLSFLDTIPQEISTIGLDDSSLDESDSPKHISAEYEAIQVNVKQEQDIAYSDSPPLPFEEVHLSKDAIDPVPNRKRHCPSSNNEDILKYIKESDKTHISMMRNISQYAQTDEFHSFAAHVEHVLKKLPPILKIGAKKEIFDILTKYEMQSIEDNIKNKDDT